MDPQIANPALVSSDPGSEQENGPTIKGRLGLIQSELEKVLTSRFSHPEQGQESSVASGDLNCPAAQHLDLAMPSGMPRYGQEDVIDPSGLIAPRKPSFPGKGIPESRELQREIAFNNKMGINVLGQKSELQKAMEKMKDQMIKKQLDEERRNDRSDLDRELEKRALRMKKYEDVMTESDITFPASENEFHRIHAKVNGRFASATS